MGPAKLICGNIDNAKYVCYGIKFVDNICSFLDNVKESIVDTVTEGIFSSIKIDQLIHF